MKSKETCWTKLGRMYRNTEKTDERKQSSLRLEYLYYFTRALQRPQNKKKSDKSGHSPAPGCFIDPFTSTEQMTQGTKSQLPHKASGLSAVWLMEKYKVIKSLEESLAGISFWGISGVFFPLSPQKYTAPKKELAHHHIPSWKNYTTECKFDNGYLFLYIWDTTFSLLTTHKPWQVMCPQCILTSS